MNNNDIIDRLREIRTQSVHQPTVIALCGLIAQLQHPRPEGSVDETVRRLRENAEGESSALMAEAADQLAYYASQDGLLQKAQDEVTRLKDELAEIQRPLDAQMARLNENLIAANARADALTNKPIDMVLHCPACGLQHIDAPEPNWPNDPHRSHLCHGCAHIWCPADVPTNGVAAVKTVGKNDSPIVQPTINEIHLTFDRLTEAGRWQAEAASYALEAVYQIVPEVKCRDDDAVLMSMVQVENLMRHFGWVPPNEGRKPAGVVSAWAMGSPTTCLPVPAVRCQRARQTAS